MASLEHLLSAIQQTSPNDPNGVVECIKDLQSFCKNGKTGSRDVPPSSMRTLSNCIQENATNHDVVLSGLQCLNSLYGVVGSPSTALRLEGGCKAVLCTMRKWASRQRVVIPAAKLLSKACNASNLTTQALVKEKDISSVLLNALSLNIDDTLAASAMLDLLLAMTVSLKGAKAIAGSAFVALARDVATRWSGEWEILGALLKALKNMAKHDDVRPSLKKSGEATRLVVDIARALAPGAPDGSKKLVKRAARVAWLLAPEVLPPKPPPEATWLIPPQTPMPSAMDADMERQQMLFPEWAVSMGQRPPDPPPAQPFAPARRCVPPPQSFPTASPAHLRHPDYASVPEPYHAEGDRLCCEQMVRHLKRVEEPSGVQNAVVYDSTWAPGPGPGSEAAAAAGRPPNLRFESRFECGNLRQAVRVYDHEYDLFMSGDVNDRDDGNRKQWFFFSVSDAEPGKEYWFNLVNFNKKDSLFNHGMKPCMWSAPPGAADGSANGAAPQQPAAGTWRRVGEGICYHSSPHTALVAGAEPAAANGKDAKGGSDGGTAAKRRPTKRKPTKPSRGARVGDARDLLPSTSTVGRGLYALSFSLRFDSPGPHYIAMCYPYSYSDLQCNLAMLAANEAPDMPNILYRTRLCNTLSGHACDLLTITDWTTSPEYVNEREYVLISGRVHPGEVNSSWVMKGVIDFLTSGHETAVCLRQTFIFKIIPMLNPDGVLNGSTRCSLAGTDLNRMWDKPSPGLHPTIWHAKRLLERLSSTGRLALFMDLHGHSNRHDAFVYGCEPVPPRQAPDDVPPLPPPAVSTPKAAPPPRRGRRAGERPRMSRTESSDAELAGSATAAQMMAAQGPPGASKQPVELPREVSLRDKSRLRIRMLPFLIARRTPSFNFARCSFKVQKTKYGCGRVVVCKEVGLPGSYTLETSFGGCSATRKHFSPGDLQALGEDLMLSIAELALCDEEELLDEMMAVLDVGKEIRGGDNKGADALSQNASRTPSRTDVPAQ